MFALRSLYALRTSRKREGQLATKTKVVAFLIHGNQEQLAGASHILFTEQAVRIGPDIDPYILDIIYFM
jgi:hypothetical protein